jgi:hypothetical protein
MDFDFSISTLFAGFIFGVIGFYLFREGKRRLNYTTLFCGVLLMIYPYFVSGPWLTWCAGFALCGLAYYTFE